MIGSNSEIQSEVWLRPHLFHITGPDTFYVPPTCTALARSEDFMKLRLAVADDNADVLSELISVLETEFDVVVTATDGKSALEGIRRCSPDVVVLDLQEARP